MMIQESKLSQSINYISKAKSSEAFSRLAFITYWLMHGNKILEMFSRVMKAGKKKVVFLSSSHPRSFTTIAK